MAADKNLILIGMPGAGKSTVGVLLAKALKMPFTDTDILIQRQENSYLQLFMWLLEVYLLMH